MKSPFLTGGINSVLTLRHGLNCVDNVPFFLIPNVLHLSIQTIRFAHLHHFLKRFNSIWLSCSVDTTRAESSANWNQFRIANEFQKLYAMKRILSSSMVLIKVLVTMWNSKGLKQSLCKTPLRTISGSVVYVSVPIVVKCGDTLILLIIICGLPLQKHFLDPIM